MNGREWRVSDIPLETAQAIFHEWTPEARRQKTLMLRLASNSGPPRVPAMKHIALASALFAASLVTVMAQVTVEVLLDQDQFLSAESIRVGVKVINRSGQTMTFGATDDWLQFQVDTDRGSTTRLGDIPVKGAFTLPSSKSGTKRLDISPYFAMTIPERYTVTATVKVPEWGQEFTSAPRSFHIIKGVKLWEQEFGLPAGPSQPPVMRKYTLQQATLLKQQRLYVRISEANELNTIKVFSLGQLVSFGQPESKVDRESKLHVLFQTGSRNFNYSVVSPEGRLLIRQTHDYTPTSRPRLSVNDEGEVVVIGGTRQVSDTDIPEPPAPPEFELPAPAAAAEPTNHAVVPKP